MTLLKANPHNQKGEPTAAGSLIFCCESPSVLLGVHYSLSLNFLLIICRFIKVELYNLWHVCCGNTRNSPYSLSLCSARWPLLHEMKLLASVFFPVFYASFYLSIWSLLIKVDTDDTQCTEHSLLSIPCMCMFSTCMWILHRNMLNSSNFTRDK